jgi:hypothetical protein
LLLAALLFVAFLLAGLLLCKLVHCCIAALQTSNGQVRSDSFTNALLK